MNLITNITSSPNQQFPLSLEDGSDIVITLNYRSDQQGWFYSISGAYTVNNKRVSVNFNLLRALRNIITFGLACVTTDGYEPINQDDFSNGRAMLFILNSTDISSLEQQLVSNEK